MRVMSSNEVLQCTSTNASTLSDPSLVDDRVEYAHSQRTLSTGTGLHPMISLGAGSPQPGADIRAFPDREGAFAHFGRTKFSILATIFDRRTPGLQEIGSERNDRFGLIEPKNWQVAPPETRLRGGTRRLFANPLPEYNAARTPGFEP